MSMEILFVALTVVLLSVVLVVVLNHTHKKFEENSSKKENSQKLLADLYKNLTEGKINQKTYDIERENIISSNSIETSLNNSESEIVGDSEFSDKSFIGKTDELLNLKKLLDEKVITQEEFEKAKEELLNFNNQKVYDEFIEATSELVETELSLFWWFVLSPVIIYIAFLFYNFWF